MARSHPKPIRVGGGSDRWRRVGQQSPATAPPLQPRICNHTLSAKHWFSLAGILAKLTDDKPVTSATLRPVCPGSRNNGSLITA